MSPRRGLEPPRAGEAHRSRSACDRPAARLAGRTGVRPEHGGATEGSVDAVTVEMTVRTAYDSFHQARVRVYVPIRVERRSRRVLRAACRTAPGQAIDDRAAPGTHRVHPGPEKD
ncbi:three-helix bundle dimerization domain-containing protein [Streptomyces sp. NPDC056004]|uniref:three-helix bundle dimerization domain-containing protein n=1 Tax=Streptomyces sp. NPDC056004 TaxID=3345677 RepID=UPI0035D53F3F